MISPAGSAPVTQSYDACGNLTGQDAGGVLSTYTWDPQDRLVVAATSASVDTFTYDAFGHRVTKVSSLGLGPQNRSYYTPIPAGYGGLSGHRQYEAGYSRFYASDLQGHTRQVTDAVGNPVATYAYSAFGEEVLESADATPLRYGGDVGYYRDDDSRLYIRARHYDPANARWLSRDPIGAAGGLNLYGYVGNSPLGNIDPSGHDNIATRTLDHLRRWAWTGDWNASNEEYNGAIDAAAGFLGEGTDIGAHAVLSAASLGFYNGDKYAKSPYFAPSKHFADVAVVAVSMIGGGVSLAGRGLMATGMAAIRGGSILVGRIVIVGGGTNAAASYLLTAASGQHYTTGDLYHDITTGSAKCMF